MDYKYNIVSLDRKTPLATSIAAEWIRPPKFLLLNSAENLFAECIRLANIQHSSKRYKKQRKDEMNTSFEALFERLKRVAHLMVCRMSILGYEGQNYLALNERTFYWNNF